MTNHEAIRLSSDLSIEGDGSVDGRACLNHLLAQRLRLSPEDSITVGEAINELIQCYPAHPLLELGDKRVWKCEEELGRMGIRLTRGRGCALLISNTHPALLSIFRNTPYADGAHALQLKTLGGSNYGNQTVRFGNIPTKVTALPVCEVVNESTFEEWEYMDEEAKTEEEGFYERFIQGLCEEPVGWDI